MKNSLEELRSHLFDVIERLKEGNDPDADPKDCIDIERAKAINNTASAIIHSAKVELDAFKLLSKEGDVTGLKKSGILRIEE